MFNYSEAHRVAFRKAVCLSYGRKKAFDCTGRRLVLYACFFIGVHISRIAEKQIKECKSHTLVVTAYTETLVFCYNEAAKKRKRGGYE